MNFAQNDFYKICNAYPDFQEYMPQFECIFQEMNCEGTGVNIEYLKLLRFSINILLILESPDKLQEILNSINCDSLKVKRGTKIKVMFNCNMKIDHKNKYSG